DGFGDVETWAAALTLAQALAKDASPANGIDRAVIALAGKRPVVELEGTRGQLGIFDALPETEQRDLLAAVATEPDRAGDTPAAAWLEGDMTAIERETHRGLLADPELRQALFTGRNLAWADRIAAMLAGGQRPFVAVGGAHMAGSEGLPALLAARGYRVTRLQ
ncbi:MAG: TraB/GumN family protein, partial [Novosphingobium sp.]